MNSTNNINGNRRPADAFRRRLDDKVRYTFGLFLLICLFLSLLQSCAYHSEEELYPDDFCETPQVVSFSRDIRPIIQANCAISGCHVPGTGVIAYTSFEGVKTVAESGALRHRVVVTRSMPPTGPLPDCTIRKIEKWINQGALNN